MNKASLVIIHFGSIDLINNLLYSLDKAPLIKYYINEIIIIDNQGNLGVELIYNIKNMKIDFIKNINDGFSKSVNIGVSRSSNDLVIISNNDIEFLPYQDLSPLIYEISKEGAGVVGPQLIYKDYRLQRSYGYIPSLKEAIYYCLFIDSLYLRLLGYMFKSHSFLNKPKSVDYIRGAFMVTRKEYFNKVGGFDETFLFYGEDSDYCHKLTKIGLKAVFVPEVKIVHVEGEGSYRKESKKYLLKLFESKLFQYKLYNKDIKKYYNLLKIALIERKVYYFIKYILLRKQFYYNKYKDYEFVLKNISNQFVKN
jgi:hypothetical protein